MDNKKKAAALIMEFLPIVGQDPYTGIQTAIDCAVKAAELSDETPEVIQAIKDYGKDKQTEHSGAPSALSA